MVDYDYNYDNCCSLFLFVFYLLTVDTVHMSIDRKHALLILYNNKIPDLICLIL